jgi:hypothetical protein
MARPKPKAVERLNASDSPQSGQSVPSRPSPKAVEETYAGGVAPSPALALQERVSQALGDTPEPAIGRPWSARRKLVFMAGAASGLWALIAAAALAVLG